MDWTKINIIPGSRPVFRAEVIADNSGEWASNGLLFDTKEEAEVYARDLASRWTAVREWRVVNDAQPRNQRKGE